MPKVNPPDTGRLPPRTPRRLDLCGNPTMGANRVPIPRGLIRDAYRKGRGALAPRLSRPAARDVSCGAAHVRGPLLRHATPLFAIGAPRQQPASWPAKCVWSGLLWPGGAWCLAGQRRLGWPGAAVRPRRPQRSTHPCGATCLGPRDTGTSWGTAWRVTRRGRRTRQAQACLRARTGGKGAGAALPPRGGGGARRWEGPARSTPPRRSGPPPRRAGRGSRRASARASRALWRRSSRPATSCSRWPARAPPQAYLGAPAGAALGPVGHPADAGQPAAAPPPRPAGSCPRDAPGLPDAPRRGRTGAPPVASGLGPMGAADVQSL